MTQRLRLPVLLPLLAAWILVRAQGTDPAQSSDRDVPPATAEAPAGPEAELVLDIGSAKVKKEYLRRGWSVPEGRNNWTNRMEADIEIPLGAPADREVEVRAAPYFIVGLRQRAGLFVNNRFAGDWVYAENHGFATHRVRVPAALWREGPNTLTLRVAYTSRRAENERRTLGLNVNKVAIYPAAPAEDK